MFSRHVRFTAHRRKIGNRRCSPSIHAGTVLYTDQLYERAYRAVRLGSFSEHRECVRKLWSCSNSSPVSVLATPGALFSQGAEMFWTTGKIRFNGCATDFSKTASMFARELAITCPLGTLRDSLTLQHHKERRGVGRPVLRADDA